MNITKILQYLVKLRSLEKPENFFIVPPPFAPSSFLKKKYLPHPVSFTHCMINISLDPGGGEEEGQVITRGGGGGTTRGHLVPLLYIHKSKVHRLKFCIQSENCIFLHTD